MKKFIKNLFFEEVEDNTSESTQQSTNIVSTNVGTPKVTDTAVIEEYDKGLYSKLLTKLKDSKVGTVSYFDFIKLVSDKVNVEAFPDPTKRFSVIFENIKLLNPELTKESLVSDVKGFIEMVTSYNTEFESKVKEDISKKIGASMQTIEELRIEESELEARLAEINSKIEQLTSEVTDSESAMQLKAKTGTNSFTKLLTELNIDLENINKYIK